MTAPAVPLALAVLGRDGALADDLRQVVTLAGAETVEAPREIELREGRL